ncbi:nicotinate phosphoribosyltransferase [Saccharopolyspora shandongensis]|uniref:Nicotinate phosphoribosyltransferase n=1 Tax=Saccharopolyspora shandongensis TaxID=418495 RepID=A0A1H3QXV1_9PSEU|nr:nicotinate phosphoribosyltransferase [Saccharopolyspora shandongensis]SDZ17549.1 nicotinate phosphoribosyltransferase [Saccharopolyspora shandongensis]
MSLCTDLYEIRMAASYLRRGMTALATFSLFARKLPRDRGFLVSAGLADCLDFLQHLHFDNDELTYLADVVGLREDDLAALDELRFTGEVWAVPEGRVVFADEPFLEVTAPIAQAQLAETALLNFVTYQSSVAAKAARCRIAAPRADLIDFAARRTHGLEAARAVARASAIVGFAGTSYVAAAREFGLPAAGTMAHSYVEAFQDERAAFGAFAEDFPGATVFLVDTYDTLQGVRTAIEVAAEARPGGHLGIRLDSGDLGELAIHSRRLLDDAGFTDARIMASGGLDEHQLAALADTPIDAFGIGTRMGVSADAPSLDSAYKLVEYSHRPVMKLSSGKLTAPGAKQVYRGDSGEPDLLVLRDETPPDDREPLLRLMMRGGDRLDGPEPVAVAHQRFDRDLQWLPDTARLLTDPTQVEVKWSTKLRRLTGDLQRFLATRYGLEDTSSR